MIENKVARIKALQMSTYFAIGAISIVLAYKNRTNGAVSLIFDKSDIYMDLVNTIFDSCRPDAYSSLGNVYPPALMGMLRTVFTPYCNEGLATAKQLRTEILGALMLSHIILIFLSGFMLGRITWALRKNRMMACIAAIIGAAWPPLIFGIDRLNLILVPYYILILSVLLSVSPAREGKEKLSTWNTYIFWTILLAVLVKPYFIVIFGFRFISECKSYRSYISLRSNLTLKYALGILTIFLVNIQPFILGLYDGSIATWASNLIRFQGTFSSNPSNLWNMYHYSLSPYEASKLFPAANMPEFLKNPEINNNLMISILALGMLFMFTITMSYCLRKLITIINLQESKLDANSRIMTELSTIVILIIIMSTLASSFGYYTGIFWVILVITVLCLGNRKECGIVVNLSMLFMIISSSNTSMLTSTSIASTTCLYVLVIFSALTIVKKLEAQNYHTAPA